MSIVIPSNAMKPISSVDKFRIEFLDREWAVNSFSKYHEHYRTQWMKVLGLQPQSDDLKRLGESLRTVMKSSEVIDQMQVLQQPVLHLSAW